MKISELTLQHVKDYCGVSDSDSDELLTAMLDAGKSYVYGYTGLNADSADEYADLTMALLVLVNEMFTTREMVIESGRMNPFAAQILGLHRVNLL